MRTPRIVGAAIDAMDRIDTRNAELADEAAAVLRSYRRLGDTATAYVVLGMVAMVIVVLAVVVSIPEQS